MNKISENYIGINILETRFILIIKIITNRMNTLTAMSKELPSFRSGTSYVKALFVLRKSPAIKNKFSDLQTTTAYIKWLKFRKVHITASVAISMWA